MATTPQGDDADVRRSVMYALARSVARQQLVSSATTKPAKPRRKLAGAYSAAKSPRTVLR